MRHPDQTGTRDNWQLTLQVDGVPLRGGTPASYTLQAVLTSFSAGERQQLGYLRDAIGSEIGVIDSHFDDAPLLFKQLGFHTRDIAGEDLGETDLRVVAISCPHRHARLDQIDTLRFLRRGGVLLTSDRAIRLAGISTFIGHLRGKAPARARLWSTGSSLDHTSAPVWLDAGHLPLDPATIDASRMVTMAWNALTGDPLVVSIRAEQGGILHSVPHWLQTPDPERSTSVELRPLRSVPEFRAIGNSFPGVNLGAFLAQRSMVDMLMQGLAAIIGSPEPAEFPQLESGK